jgi:hypothetical protein
MRSDRSQAGVDLKQIFQSFSPQNVKRFWMKMMKMENIERTPESGTDRGSSRFRDVAM